MHRALALMLASALVARNGRAEEAPPAPTSPTSVATPSPAVPRAQSVERPWWFNPPPAGQRTVYFEATDADAELQEHVYDVSRKLAVLAHAKAASAPSSIKAPVWRTVCERAPCVARVQIGAEYRVSGHGITSSRTFKVYPNPGPFALRARTGSSTTRTVGFVMLGVGATALLVGTTWMGLYAAGCWACTEAEKSRGAAPGLVLSVSGFFALGVGLGLALANGTSLDFGVKQLQQFRPVLVPQPDVH